MERAGRDGALVCGLLDEGSGEVSADGVPAAAKRDDAVCADDDAVHEGLVRGPGGVVIETLMGYRAGACTRVLLAAERAAKRGHVLEVTLQAAGGKDSRESEQAVAVGHEECEIGASESGHLIPRPFALW